MVKNTKSVIYKMMLMQKRIRTFEKANRMISKQRKVKKTRIQPGEVLNIQNANALLNAKEVDTQLEKEMYTNGRNRDRGRTTMQRYDNCSKPGHNARIYKKDEEMSNVYSSD